MPAGGSTAGPGRRRAQPSSGASVSVKVVSPGSEVTSRTRAHLHRELVRDREPEARAARPVGAVEGLEDALERLLGDARACVV